MGLYVTDADLAWRARGRGWRAVYEPRAVAYHVRTFSPSARQRTPPVLRRIQFRNRYLMMLKNETPATFLRHLPAIALFELMALGYAVLREPFLLRGYLEAARLASEARRRRRAAPARTAPAADILPFLRGLAPSP
jgi:GT2 family glycosyltransferase